MLKKLKTVFNDISKIRDNSKFSRKQKRQLLSDYIKVSALSFFDGRFIKIGKVTILGTVMRVNHMGEFINLYREVIVSDFYRTKIDKTPECIVDAGANIGFSAIYFRWLYPGSKIICFEPDPDTFLLLKQNLLADTDSNLDMHNIALSDKTSVIPFYKRMDLSIASTTSDVNAEKSEKIEVRSSTLSPFIESEVDVLKMDIERMETMVFKELLATKTLDKVKTFVLEYHYDYSDFDNKFSDLLSVFDESGFVYTVTLLSDKLPEYKTYRIEGWRP